MNKIDMYERIQIAHYVHNQCILQGIIGRMRRKYIGSVLTVIVRRYNGINNIYTLIVDVSTILQNISPTVIII